MMLNEEWDLHRESRKEILQGSDFREELREKLLTPTDCQHEDHRDVNYVFGTFHL